MPILKYKVCSVSELSTNYDVRWFNSESEAKSYVKDLKFNDPSLKIDVKAWEFEVYEPLKVVNKGTVRLSNSKWNYEIKENAQGLYSIDIENNHTIDGLFYSIEDAVSAVGRWVYTS